MVRCVVNGNFLLTSNLAAEKHVHFSIGQAGIQYSVPAPAPLSDQEIMHSSSPRIPFWEHDYARNLRVSLPHAARAIEGWLWLIYSSFPHHHMLKMIRAPVFTPAAELWLEPKAGAGTSTHEYLCQPSHHRQRGAGRSRVGAKP